MYLFLLDACVDQVYTFIFMHLLSFTKKLMVDRRRFSFYLLHDTLDYVIILLRLKVVLYDIILVQRLLFFFFVVLKFNFLYHFV